MGTNVEHKHLDKMKKNITEKQKKDNKKKAHQSSSDSSSSSNSSSSSEDEDEETVKKAKLAEALKRLEEEELEAERVMKMDERKRKYNSFKGDSNQAPTEEDLEAYYIKRQRDNDPMAQFLSK